MKKIRKNKRFFNKIVTYLDGISNGCCFYDKHGNFINIIRDGDGFSINGDLYGDSFWGRLYGGLKRYVFTKDIFTTIEVAMIVFRKCDFFANKHSDDDTFDFITLNKIVDNAETKCLYFRKVLEKIDCLGFEKFAIFFFSKIFVVLLLMSIVFGLSLGAEHAMTTLAIVLSMLWVLFAFILAVVNIEVDLESKVSGFIYYVLYGEDAGYKYPSFDLEKYIQRYVEVK